MCDRKKSTRTAFMEALLEIGQTQENVVTVAADSQSRFGDFPKKFPERSFNVGIAEQTMVGAASGLAMCGKIPVIASYANFMTFRAAEQIRVDVASTNANVKMIGTDTAFSSAWLGFTHQALEDIAVIKSIPNIVIIDPSDAVETYYATKKIVDYEGPVYMRVRARREEPILPIKRQNFTIGKGEILSDGKDVLLVACGSAVYESFKAVEKLASKGIKARLINMPTIRPIDEELLLKEMDEIKNVVTIEYHNINGGLGSTVADLIAEKAQGVHLMRLGVKDFGIPGTEEMLRRNLMLDSEGITKRVEGFLA